MCLPPLPRQSAAISSNPMNNTPLTVASSVNAGLCLVFPNQEKIWVDLFPSGETRLFSFLKEEEWEQIKKNPVYYPPDFILFTHTHEDHYCSSRAKEMQTLLPNVPLILPADQQKEANGYLPADAIFVTGHQARLHHGPITIRMVSTRHSGLQYAATKHYSIFLSYEEKTIFISGDADFHNCPELMSEMETQHPDLAILTFPWASTTTGRQLIENHMQPKHVLLYHVPNPPEDREGFRQMALDSVSQVNVPDCRVLGHTMQKEEYLL